MKARSCQFSRMTDAGGVRDVVRVNCRNWNCPRCRPKLVRKWLIHVSRIFRSLGGGGFPLARLVVAVGAWDSFARRLRRQRSPYFRLRWSESEYVVWVQSAELGEYGAERAIELLSADLKAMSGLHRCIASSRGWGLPKDDDGEERPAQVEQQRPVFVRPEAVVAVAKAMHLVFPEPKSLDRITIDLSHCDAGRVRFFDAEVRRLSAECPHYSTLNPPATKSVNNSWNTSVKAPVENTNSDIDAGEQGEFTETWLEACSSVFEREPDPTW